MPFFDSSIWSGSKPKSLIPKCGQCGLFKTCISPKMKPTGAGKRRVLFVGEAPGETEDRQGVQLVGGAGQCLRKMLRQVGADLDDCFKTDAIICRPKNEINDLYIESCQPNLLNTIRDLKPSVIVLMGPTAVKSLISTEWGQEVGQLSRWVGWTIPSQKHGAWLCPTYHPSYVHRQREDLPLFNLVCQHLAQALSLEHKTPRGYTFESLSNEVEIIPDPQKGLNRITDLMNKEGVLAFDYETTGLKPERKEQQIVMCSFCLNGRDTFSTPIVPESYGSLSAVLRNPKLLKVASNLKFEERWTRCKLGHPVASWYWDTMLGAHVIDNRPGICSIKFLAYINFGVGDYSSWMKPYLETADANGLNRILEAPLNDVLLYCGIDSLLEYREMERQRELTQWNLLTNRN